MKKKIICIILTIVPVSTLILIFIIMKILSLNVFFTKIDKDGKKYNDYKLSINGADVLLPDISNLSQENYLFSYKKTYKRNFFTKKIDFSSEYDCVSLFVTYEVTEYAEVKNELNDKNPLNETIETSIDGKKYYVFPTFEFEFKNYNFKIFVNELYSSYGQITAQSFMMVGFDDLNYKICYLYYFNYDSIYLCDSNVKEEKYNDVMIKIIKKYFYWYD